MLCVRNVVLACNLCNRRLFVIMMQSAFCHGGCLDTTSREFVRLFPSFLYYGRSPTSPRGDNTFGEVLSTDFDDLEEDRHLAHPLSRERNESETEKEKPRRIVASLPANGLPAGLRLRGVVNMRANNNNNNNNHNHNDNNYNCDNNILPIPEEEEDDDGLPSMMEVVGTTKH